jgi:hypothetical protein
MKYFNDAQMYTYFLYVNKNEKNNILCSQDQMTLINRFHGFIPLNVVFKIKFESTQ